MQALNEYLSAVPGWVLAVIVLAVGWLVAALTQFIIARALRLFRFNHLCDRIGVCDVMRKGEVLLTPSQLAGRGIYWVILIGVLLEAARILDIRLAIELRQRAVAAIPTLLSGVLVLAAGLLVVTFLSGFVRTLCRNAGSPYANLWSRITRGIGVTLVLALAVEQAEILGSVLAGVVYIIVAAVALGTALAFGLGCKDMARNAMEKWITSLKERHRDSSKPDMEG
jgi:hypothetical protein